MSAWVYLLALTTALAWGIAATLAKRGFSRGGNPVQSSVIVVGVSALVSWIFAMGWHGGEHFITGLSFSTILLFAVAGLFGNGVGRFLTLYGIDRLGITVNTAGINTRPLFAAGLAVIWLGESVQFLLLIGIVLVVCGVITLVFSKGGDLRGWHTWQLLIPLGAAASFAAGNAIRRFGLTTTTASPIEGVVIDQVAAFGVLLIYAYSQKSSTVFAAPSNSYLFFVGSGLVGAIGHICLFEALARGPVAIVDPLVATQPLFTTLLAYLLLGDLERVTLRLVVGTALIILGACIIMLYEVPMMAT